jgi:hypothetical protein
MSGMSDLPMKTSDDAQAAIQQLAAGSIATVFLSLDQATEVMSRGECGDISVADIARQLPVCSSSCSDRSSHTNGG